MYVFIHRDISVVENCKSNGHKVSKEYRWVTSKSSGAAGNHLDWRCSPGENIIENLDLELVKSFNPNRRDVRVPEYRSRNKRSYYHPMATCARKTHSHVSKSFAMSRLDSGQGVGRGIPTRSRLWYQLVTPPIWPYTNHARKYVRSRSRIHETISQHNSRHKLK